MKNIRYFLIYISLLVVLQMLYFSIYNIPIYKIYCELNNYYLNSQNLYDQINYKYYIYVELKNNSYDTYRDNIDNASAYNACVTSSGGGSRTLVSGAAKYINDDVYESYFRGDVTSQIKNTDNVIYNIDRYYSFRGQSNTENKISLLHIDSLKGETNLYIVVFKAATTNVNLVEFITLQNSMYIAPSETYLVFFRIYNPTDYIIKGISIYFISPNTVSVYVLKIQCFCFDELLLYWFESVDLPILFYISSEIISLNLKIVAYVQIHITYLFILNNF